MCHDTNNKEHFGQITNFIVSNGVVNAVIKKINRVKDIVPHIKLCSR